MHWSTEDMPAQTGRIALVTGANSGLGYQTTAASQEDARRLWEVSEELTGVAYGLPEPPTRPRKKRQR